MNEPIEYAKTDSTGTVIEYPVYEHHIENRGHLIRSYEHVHPVAKPEFDELTQTVAKRKAQRGEDGLLYQVWVVIDKPEPLLREDMLAELADLRWKHETGGITLPNGVEISTTREDQGMTDSAYSSLKNGLIPDTDWKGPNGWGVVTLAELEPIAQAVALHVRASFGAERIVAEQISAASYTALKAMANNLKAELLAAYAAKMGA